MCVCLILLKKNEGSSFVVVAAATKYLNKKTNQERVYVHSQFQVTVLHRRDVKVARTQNNWLHPIYTQEQREVNIHMLARLLACLLALCSISPFLSIQFPTPYLRNGATHNGLGISTSINSAKAIPHKPT